MTFETVDWAAEATRVAAAFGLVGKCEFVVLETVVQFQHEGERFIEINEGLCFSCTYEPGWRAYEITDAIGLTFDISFDEEGHFNLSFETQPPRWN